MTAPIKSGVEYGNYSAFGTSVDVTFSTTGTDKQVFLTVVSWGPRTFTLSSTTLTWKLLKAQIGSAVNDATVEVWTATAATAVTDEVVTCSHVGDATSIVSLVQAYADSQDYTSLIEGTDYGTSSFNAYPNDTLTGGILSTDITTKGTESEVFGSWGSPSNSAYTITALTDCSVGPLAGGDIATQIIDRTDAPLTAGTYTVGVDHNNIDNWRGSSIVVVEVLGTAGGGGDPTVSTVSDASETEGTSLVHTVTLSAATTASTDYAISLSGGTATGGGTDYTFPTVFSNGVTESAGTLTVPSGVSSFTITVATTQDAFVEGNETYNITVGGVSGTGTIVDDDATSTIAATDLTNHKIYQRISNAKDIIFSGTNTGELPNNIQVQLYASDGTTVEQAWTALTSTTITGTTFTGTLSVPEGGMYRFAVRSRNSGNTVLATSSITTNLWGVGALLHLIGDSGTEQSANSDSGTGYTANANVRRYNQADAWADAGTDGAVIDCANTYNTDQGVPVGFIDGGIGSSALVQWADNANSLYVEFLSDLSNVGGKLEAVIVHVGSNDAVAGGFASKSAADTLYTTLLSNIRTDTGQASLPIFIMGTTGISSANDTQFDYLREVEQELEGTVANTYYGANGLDAEVSVDDLHPTPAGYQLVWSRLSLSLLDVFGAGTYHRGPNVASFTASGTTGTVTITHVGGTDITVNSSHGFTASDGSGVLAISSATRASPTTIALTFGRTIDGTVVLNYGAGSRPIESGEGVRDNTTETLPLEVNINITLGVSYPEYPSFLLSMLS